MYVFLHTIIFTLKCYHNNGQIHFREYVCHHYVCSDFRSQTSNDMSVFVIIFYATVTHLLFLLNDIGIRRVTQTRRHNTYVVWTQYEKSIYVGRLERMSRVRAYLVHTRIYLWHKNGGRGFDGNDLFSTNVRKEKKNRQCVAASRERRRSAPRSFHDRKRTKKTMTDHTDACSTAGRTSVATRATRARSR